jgi:hypothetical protein
MYYSTGSIEKLLMEQETSKARLDLLNNSGSVLLPVEKD